MLIKAPATTANLGPGFDCLGMALDFFNEVEVKEGDRLFIQVKGEGEGRIPLNEDNLIYKAISSVYKKVGKPPPTLHISCQNNIPLARGLGSSASAIACGLLAANFLLGEPFSLEELLQIGFELEGHADNIAPALFGGLQIVTKEKDKILHTSIPLPHGLKVVLFIPDFEMPTMKSRVLLSPFVPREDAVFNLGRVAMLITAFTTGQFHLLRLATQDKLHQPARKALFKSMEEIFKSALEAGSLGVFLSGGGSSICALTTDEVLAYNIGEAMKSRASLEGIKGKTLITKPSPIGAHKI